MKMNALVAGLIVTSWMSALVSAEPVGEPSVYKTVNGRALQLFVNKPADWKAADQRPAIVLFHGGAWVGGTPTALNPEAEYFASRGMVSVLVEYRLLVKKTKTPPAICIQDAKSAMRWVRSHAQELGVDPQRIAAGGGSAGGHLAAFVGIMDGLDDPQDDKTVSPKANALVLFNPVFDNGPGGYGHERVGDRYKEFSPAQNISSNAPPAIIFLGTNDKLIPVKTVETFQAAMKRAGVRCDAFFYEGQGHGFFNREPYLSKTLFEADKFLVSLGWLKGPTPSPAPAAAKSGAAFFLLNHPAVCLVCP